MDERSALGQWVGLSLQHMFSMFGSMVLVSILVGLNPGIALFSSGVGTLMYLLITQHKIPAYRGSSFSFVVPMMVLMKSTGYPGIAQGTVAVDCVYLVVSLVVTRFGSGWIDRVLPPIGVGRIVMVIGIGNAYLQLGQYQFSGLAVAAVLSIFLNLILPQEAVSDREGEDEAL